MMNTLKVLKVRTIVFAITMLLVAVTSQSIQAQFLHPKIKSKETTIRRIIILPAVNISAQRRSMAVKALTGLRIISK